MASSADDLALPQTIFSGLGLLAILVAIFALAVERIRRVKEYDNGHETTKATLMGCFAQKPVGFMASLMGRHAPTLAIPSIGGLIEAADRGFWTSTTLDHMPEIHPELTWIPLYESIFGDLLALWGQLPASWKGNASTARAFKKMNHKAHGEHTSELAIRRRALLKNEILVNGIRKLPRNVVPGTTGEPQPSLTTTKDAGKGLDRLKPIWLVGKKPCIPVTREELAALSLVMGMPITKSNDGYYSGIGAYGLSIDLAHTEATWNLSLVKGSRIPRHAPSMGGGYTALMAKHLGCGSVPFGESVGGDWVRSVYVTDKVLEAVKSGGCIMDTRAYGGPSLEFLRRLPADKGVDAYYGIAPTSADSPLGAILDAEGHEVGRWARLVAGIAFGGLVPQADHNVVEVVQFTVAGKVDDCVQNLERLVDRLHEEVVHLRLDGDVTQEEGEGKEMKIFGERVAERTAATGHMYVNHSYPQSDKNTRDAASTFGRYMNLVERVIARCEGPAIPVQRTTQDVATEQRRHQDLESGGGNISNNIPLQRLSQNSQPSDRVFDQTVQLLTCVYIAAVKAKKMEAERDKLRWQMPDNQRTILSDEERALVDEDLGKTLNDIGDALRGHEAMPLESAAKVVRCVLAAWANTVPRIDVVEHLPLGRSDSSGVWRARQTGGGTGVIFMDGLPSVMALG